MKFNALTLTLNNFIAAFSGGYGRMSGVANGLLAALAAIDLVLLGFWWALGGGERLTHVFKKILYLGFWIWATRSFPTIANTFVQTLISAGTMAGGGGGSTNILLDPSAVAGHGLDATQPLAQKLSDMGITDISQILVLSIPYLLLILCFLVMAINCFLTVLEYYLVVALVGIFLPFALFPSTKFMAEKALGAVVSVGMKLMTLAFVMAVVEPTLSKIHFASDEIALNELFAMLLTAGGCTFLSWQAPRLAAGLMSGSPSLSAGDIAQHATAAAGMAAMGVGMYQSYIRNHRKESDRQAGSGASAGTLSSASAMTGPSSAKAAAPAASDLGPSAATAGPPKASASLVRSIAPNQSPPGSKPFAS